MPSPLDLRSLRVLPLRQRKHLACVEEILRDPDSEPTRLDDVSEAHLRPLVEGIVNAREHERTVMLIYGAHLLRNGAARIVDRMLQQGWVTHLATNGAGSIHDWEFAWLGASCEDVRANVATGTFGTWDETSRCIHLALLVGALEGLGYGRSLGKFIVEDGTTIPDLTSLTDAIVAVPLHPRTAARADLAQTLAEQNIPPGRVQIEHGWKHASIFASAYRNDIPLSVHPGIGYDIIANHPIFNGAVLGRAAATDFALFGGAVEQLDEGVVLNVGSAIMGPQVFEKSLSCVNNLRIQRGDLTVRGHRIYVVDLQDGGHWDWSKGEPPKDHPAYYLRFCKSYARMGGEMHYLQADNVSFLHRLCWELRRYA